MRRPITSDEGRRRYELVRSGMEAEVGATAGHMMGMPMLYLHGKGFAGLFGDAMVFKLGGADHTSALAMAGAALFDPSGVGRPMKAWVEVPMAGAADWPRLARLAADGLLKGG
jgi:hypothetical protein